MSDSHVLVRAEEAHQLIVDVLCRLGVSENAADLQAEWLVEGDLRGHSSHGIARLPVLVGRIEAKLIDPAAVPRVDWRSDAVLYVNGNMGLGPVTVQFALAEAMTKLPSTGVVIVAIANANHLGMLAPYVERVARDGIVAIALTTSEALVHPWGGRSALIGTNPLAIAVPAAPQPLVVDMATGEISMGRILHHRELGEQLRPGWALDSLGNPTTDPREAALGSISPFGGAKGFALGLAIEVLVASLTASALGTDVRGTLDTQYPCNKGDVFILINPSFVAGSAVIDSVSRYLDEVRESPRQDQHEAVRIPGERSARDRARRLKEGIEISRSSWEAAVRLNDATFLHDTSTSSVCKTVFKK